jgi:IclR family transcriptional regulator, acetate operon repressor
MIEVTSDQPIVSKAFAILGAFREDFVLGVSEISRRTGIPRTTVHRLANQLLDEGALRRVGSKFRVGPTLLELGQLHFPERLRHTLQPVLDDLQRMTSGDVSLLEPIGDEVITIMASRSRRPSATSIHVGRRLPVHSCAGGHLLLALNEARMPESLSRLTPNTVTSASTLRKRLESVRTTAIAIEHGEGEIGRSSIAVGARNRHGRVLGALMVSGPTASLDVDLVSASLQTFSQTFTLVGHKVGSVGFFASARPKS